MITQLLELQKTELHAEECLKVSPYDIKAYLEEKNGGVSLSCHAEERRDRVGGGAGYAQGLDLPGRRWIIS